MITIVGICLWSRKITLYHFGLNTSTVKKKLKFVAKLLLKQFDKHNSKKKVKIKKNAVVIYVTVNLDVSRTYSGGSQEPELGGPCTVGDSFEPLGVFMIVT